MNFIPDLTNLLKRQLLTKFNFEIERDYESIYITIPDELPYSKTVGEINLELTVCYNRILFRNPKASDRKVSIIVKNSKRSATISFPQLFTLKSR